MTTVEPPALLADQARTRPHELAVCDATRGRTWSELADRVNRWSVLLAEHGIRPGDAVALMLGNRVEMVEALLACLHYGITVVPINWHLTAAEVAYLLSDSTCRAVIVDPPRQGVATAAVCTVDGHGESSELLRLVVGQTASQGWSAVEPALARAGGRSTPQTCGELLLYTSGTTGSPKGVRNGLFVADAPFTRVFRLLKYAADTLAVPSDGSVLLVGPWYHSAQLFFSLLPLLNGARLVIGERFDPRQTLELMNEQEITECHLVPTQMIRLLRLEETTRLAFDAASLRRVWHGGAACPAPVKQQMIDWWGPVLLEYYAATEGGVVTLVDSQDWLRRPGTVGRPIPPNQVLIVDEHGGELPTGQIGRVFISRPGRGFSYHNAEEKTQAAHLRPGVFTYGELGYLDPDGYLFLTGRAQDVIITGGVNVYPAEVESVLTRHPAVDDVAVVGVPDDEFGERVAALVQLADAEQPPAWSELDAHCRRWLAGFKVPRRYRAVTRLPREESGKIRKDQLHPLLVHGGDHEGAWVCL